VDPLQGFDAAQARHGEVEDDHVGTLVFDPPQALEAVARLESLHPLALELLGQDRPQLVLVVDDEHFHGRRLLCLTDGRGVQVKCHTRKVTANAAGTLAKLGPASTTAAPGVGPRRPAGTHQLVRARDMGETTHP
jgi:hypothetical protein